LSESVEFLTVRLPELRMPPPQSACPRVIVSESKTMLLAVTRNTRLFPSASTVNDAREEASIVSGLSSQSAVPPNVMVALSNAPANVTCIPKSPVPA